MTSYGFDQSGFPGVARMHWLRTNSQIAVTGFYLGPAPYHSDTGWMAARQGLADRGWGFLPVYVGLQSGASALGSGRGSQDGAAAAALMARAGFAPGAVAFLDIETGGPIGPAFEAYVNAWVPALKAAGYTPGLYCSHRLISWAAPKVGPIWSFHLPAGTAGQTYDPASLPTGAIDPGAVATQYRQNVYLDGYGHSQIDLNVCASADPSRP